MVDDGAGDTTREVARRAEVRCVSHDRPRSLNAARNTGLRESAAPLIAFVDDDVLAPPGWLDGSGRRSGASCRGGGLRRAHPRALRGRWAAQLRP